MEHVQAIHVIKYWMAMAFMTWNGSRYLLFGHSQSFSEFQWGYITYIRFWPVLRIVLRENLYKMGLSFTGSSGWCFTSSLLKARGEWLSGGVPNKISFYSGFTKKSIFWSNSRTNSIRKLYVEWMFWGWQVKWKWKRRRFHAELEWSMNNKLHVLVFTFVVWYLSFYRVFFLG